jgi:ribosome recycling factor
MSNFDQVIKQLKSDLATIRTGRASASLVENLEVEAYETKMPLKELAGISIPEARQWRMHCEPPVLTQHRKERLCGLTFPH